MQGSSSSVQERQQPHHASQRHTSVLVGTSWTHRGCIIHSLITVMGRELPFSLRVKTTTGFPNLLLHTWIWIALHKNQPACLRTICRSRRTVHKTKKKKKKSYTQIKKWCNNLSKTNFTLSQISWRCTDITTLVQHPLLPLHDSPGKNNCQLKNAKWGTGFLHLPHNDKFPTTDILLGQSV